MVDRSKKTLVLALALTAVAGLALTAWGRTSAGNSTTRSSVSNSIRNSVRTLLRSSEPPAVHSIPLSTAQVSMLDDNRVVVLMDAKGELPGSLTLTVERDSTGTTVVGGSWVLVVSYTEFTPLGHPDPDGAGEAQSERLVQKGTLSGTISGGTLALDANGNVISFDALQLIINQGSVAYDGVTEGTGSAQETDLQDVVNSAGTLILNF